jgi:hypothetical protein
MRVYVIAAAVFVLICEVAFAIPPKKLFDATLEDVQGGGRVLNVSFYGKLPRPDVVDKIVRESLEHAILIDPTVDILATGFLGDDTLNSNQYSGSLVYSARQKKVMTFDEYRGVKANTLSTSSYFVEILEEKTLPGIKPEKKWLSVTIVFPKQPPRNAAYDAIFVETQKLVSKGFDISVYVSVGDQNVKTSWKQMRDIDGAYVFAEYDSASKKLTRKGQLLKQLR